MCAGNWATQLCAYTDPRRGCKVKNKQERFGCSPRRTASLSLSPLVMRVNLEMVRIWLQLLRALILTNIELPFSH